MFTVKNESMYKKEDVIVLQLRNLERIEFSLQVHNWGS